MLLGYPILNRAQPIQWANPLNKGLKHWWMVLTPADGRARLVDLCRHSNATLTNGALLAGPRGRMGGYGALSLDGSNDYADAGDTEHVNFGAADFTLSAWVNNATQTTVDMIFGKDDVSSGRQLGFALNTTTLSGLTAGAVYVFIFSSPGIYISRSTAGGTVAAAVWVHVLWQRRRAVWECYVNGKSVAFTESSGSGADADAPENVTASLNIGRRSYSGFEDYFTGYLDDLQIRNGASFSAGEAYQFYVESKQRYPTTLNWLPSSLLRVGGAAQLSGDEGALWYLLQEEA